MAGESFDGPVVPEATPNPRTIRFITPPIHDGPSRWYESAADVDDPRVARLFAAFDDIANVLVGPDFVAVGLRHPDRWEPVFDSLLRAITTEFASGASDPEAHDPVRAESNEESSPSSAESTPGGGRLERAWKELGALRPDDPDDLTRILAAVSSSDSAIRQVAARLLEHAGAEVSEHAWSRMLDDTSRGVRRAVVVAMVDADRPTLRPLLERALGDSDAWTRWKALRGIVELGSEASRTAVAPLADDPDFRVRLEAARALSGVESP
jgi:HEAT repeat protein